MKIIHIIESYEEFKNISECDEEIYEGWLGSLLSSVGGALKKALSSFMKPYSDLFIMVKKDMGAIVSDAKVKTKFIDTLKQSYTAVIKEINRAENPEEIQAALGKFKASIENTKETFGLTKLNESAEDAKDNENTEDNKEASNTTSDTHEGSKIILSVFDKITLGFAAANKSIAQMILKKIDVEKMRTEASKIVKEAFTEAMKQVKDVKLKAKINVDPTKLEPGTIVRYQYKPGRTTKVKVIEYNVKKETVKVVDDEGTKFNINTTDIVKIVKKKDNEKKEETV
jgi:hypothetical protein